MIRSAHNLVVLVIIFTIVGCAFSADADKSNDNASTVGRWTKLVTPEPFSSAAVAKDGALWIGGEHAAFCWRDGVWVDVSVPRHNGKVLSDINVMVLGGDLFVFGKRPGWGCRQVYRLDGKGLVWDRDLSEACWSGDFEYVGKSIDGVAAVWGAKALWRSDFEKPIKSLERLSSKATHVLVHEKDTLAMASGKLFRLSADGSLNECKFDIGRPRSTIADVDVIVFNDDYLLVYDRGQKQCFIYDLAADKQIPAGKLETAFVEFGQGKLFAGPDGEAILLAPLPGEAERMGLVYIDGPNDCTVVPLPEEIGMPAAEAIGKPFFADDDSIWLTWHGCIFHYESRQLQIVDWRQGLAGRIHTVVPISDEQVFAIGDDVIYQGDLSAEPEPMSDAMSLWEEIETTNDMVIHDWRGDVWMFLDDGKDAICRWDDGIWYEIKLPFDERTVRKWCAADTNQLMLIVNNNESYVVTPMAVSRAMPVTDAIVKMVEAGARRFLMPDPSEEIVVIEKDNVWRSWSVYRSALHYDGTTWEDSDMPLTGASYMPANNAMSICYGADGTVWLSDGCSWVAMNAPEKPAVISRHSAETRWLVGPAGIQPYDAKLLADESAFYAPIDVLPYSNRSKRSAMPNDVQDEFGIRMADAPDCCYPSPFGVGFWFVPNGERLIGDQLCKCDWPASPVSAFERPTPTEDRYGNLWFTGCGNHVFKRRRPPISLTVDAPTRTDSHSVKATVAFESELKDLPPMRVYWRVAGYDWDGGVSGPTVEIPFEKPGEHWVELRGVDAFGQSTFNDAFVINVMGAVPETELDKGVDLNKVITVRGLEWKAPVTLVPTDDGETPTLAYRLPKHDWVTCEQGHFVSLARLTPGEYEIELAGQNGECYRDATPITLKVLYEPHYPQIAKRLVRRIIGKAEDDEKGAWELIETMAVFPKEGLEAFDAAIAKEGKRSTKSRLLRRWRDRLKFRVYLPKEKESK